VAWAKCEGPDAGERDGFSGTRAPMTDDATGNRRVVFLALVSGLVLRA
jgi:hypothetical protein